MEIIRKQSMGAEVLGLLYSALGIGALFDKDQLRAWDAAGQELVPVPTGLVVKRREACPEFMYEGARCRISMNTRRERCLYDIDRGRWGVALSGLDLWTCYAVHPAENPVLVVAASPAEVVGWELKGGKVLFQESIAEWTTCISIAPAGDHFAVATSGKTLVIAKL